VFSGQWSVVGCHSEEANSSIWYLAQKHWPTKNLSFLNTDI
jgi:hypothetical protein